MMSYSLVYSRRTLAMICGIAFIAGIVTFRAQADEWDKKTIITVDQPIQIRDTVLDPGQYVLKLYNSSSDRHIVQIFNRDQNHIIGTVMAIPKQRMEPAGDSQFTFWETPSGTARAMRTWFYPGDTIGQEFPYPKHLKELAMAEPPSPAPVSSTTTQAEQPQTPAPSQSMTSQPAEETQPVEEAQPVETAQNPPAVAQPPAPVPPPEPQTAPEPQELPKTGSNYPLIGLCGLVFVCLSGLLRLKRPAKTGL
jgi:LPXTG-motif cell wall-anchored protein